MLVILRDPVERTASGVTHEIANGQAITTNVVIEHMARSRYAPQIRRLYDHFPREQVLVLQFERLVTDPIHELHRTQLFLGLETRDPSGQLATRPVNATRTDRWSPPASVAAAIRDDLRLDLDELRGLCPAFDWDAWPSAR